MAIKDQGTNIGFQSYPYLKRFPKWRITSHHGLDIEAILAEEEISLRIVKGHVNDYFVPGFDTTQFLTEIGLEANLNKGPFVTSKRLSRLLREYREGMYGFYDDVRIVYDAKLNGKTWDGAGLISRQFLKRLARNHRDKTSRHYRHTKYELATIGRVEYTVQSRKGQDKGHAIVIDTDDWDLYLPEDTKDQVVSLTDDIFVGINPVHSKDSMNLDVQSHINLYPFFQIHDLKHWLRAEAELFLQAIENGDVEAMLSRAESVNDFKGWWLKEYCASGGETMWFAGVIRSMGGQHANKINKTNHDKFKLPVPGGRYYVMVDEVGQKAGIKPVQPGTIRLDREHGTAWVSAADWPEWSGIWGGADQDDALWIFPFTDHDSSQKLLAWRSPNQLGEYILAEVDPDSDVIVWPTITDPIVYTQMNSQLLPPRIDTMATKYMTGMVRPVKVNPGPYTLEAMNTGLEQMVANAGTLGMLVNLMMVVKSLYGQGPKTLPARLEEVIDASQKTGDDISKVKQWIYEYAAKLIRHHPQIPFILQERIKGLVSSKLRQTIVPTNDHWMDNVIAVVEAHLFWYREQLDALAAKAAPPQKVLEIGAPWIEIGGQFREFYGSLIQEAKQRHDDEILTSEDFEWVNQRLENALDRYPIETQRHILMGYFARVYLAAREKRISDSAAWMLGDSETYMARRTLEALRYFNVLEEVVDTPDGLMTYWRKTNAPPPQGNPIQINGVWFSELAKQYPKMGDVPEQQRKSVKQQIAEQAAQGRYNNQKFEVKTLPYGSKDRTVLYRNGELFGFIKEGHEHFLTGPLATIHIAVAYDGNLFAYAS